MSLLYRAVWKDCTEESDQRAVVELAHESFSRWALDDPDATPIGLGETVVGDKVLHLRVLDSDDMYGIEAQSRVSRGSAIWSVTLRALATGSAVHVWMDLGMETDEPSQPVTVGPPRVVHDLLALSNRPSLGVTDMVSDVATITTAEIPGLIELLRRTERRIPFIVCAAPAEHTDPHWTERARRIAHRTRGIATVVTLDGAATPADYGHLGRLRQAMEANGQSDLFWGLSQAPSSHNGAPPRPETVQDVSEAVAAAWQHLGEWVTIAPGAVASVRTAVPGRHRPMRGSPTWSLPTADQPIPAGLAAG
ncbi:hypothetical protein O7621_12200 [Solwaraspora sp. WMMD937]|uniref:hypothetical protein n=1 Tax=Solwaraspora sp. WMMD937 TaxID=3016090 RepID=UPI00249C8409|nr:hypothetical protein [Solwaraspora sp. WMMD937]WFE23959.1 hypothetical protein O7621_12200 [Solwaraspora sp. WMMD937]